MNGNFNPVLNRRHDGAVVDARGWLIWDDGDESADITVTISQNGTTITGEPFTCRPHDDTWRIDVGPAEFLRGSATGTATATVHTEDGDEQFFWQSPPLALN